MVCTWFAVSSYVKTCLVINSSYLVVDPYMNLCTSIVVAIVNFNCLANIDKKLFLDNSQQGEK